MYRKLAGLALCASLSLVPAAFGQSVESIPFRVNMSSANEVPAIEGLNATGFGTVWVHVVKDAAGKITSGTVDFNVRYQFPSGITVTGFHIHRGAATGNGPVLIDTRITAANNVVDETGRGEIARSVQVLAGTANVAVLEELIANPEAFYLNMHTTVNPGGAIRAQMTKAERRVYGAMLLPTNEVPVVNSQARGIGFVTILAGLNSARQLVSSEVTFELTYSGFTDGLQFTGMHIHSGSVGVNGPVTIDTGLSRAQNIFVGTGGAGTLKYAVDVNMASAPAVNTVAGIFADPGSAYWNLHTVTNAGGEIRSQLRGTEKVSFTMMNMSPANENPPIQGLNATGAGTFEANLLRRPDGTAMAALVVFDANVRFPGETTFTGMHIHTGAQGINGPVTLDSGIRAGSTILTDTGFANLYKTAVMSTDAQLTSLNGVLTNPDNQYMNIHTSVNTGGAVRAQLLPVNTATPTLETVISAVSDTSLRRVAPGGLMTIFGTNLAELAGNLDGWQAARVPTSLNGTSVDVGGRAAAILNVDPRFVVAQVPTDVAIGDAMVTVRNTNGVSGGVRVAVDRVAPAVFFDQISNAGNRAVAYSATNGEQVTAASPAAGGTMVAIFTTGFGLATPAQVTGDVVTATQRYADVKVTVGGREASNVSAVLIPGYVGFSQTMFMAPTGLTGGQALEIEFGGVKSNRTLLYLR